MAEMREETGALEHALMDAWCRKDRPALEQLIGDDFQLSSALGRRMGRAVRGTAGPACRARCAASS